MRLTDAQFKYVPSNKTNVAATWRRFGFRPTTDAERRARQRCGFADPAAGPAADSPIASKPMRRPPIAAAPRSNVTPLTRAAGE